MDRENKPKKRVVTSYINLSAELQQELKKKYPHGFSEAMLRIEKSPDDFFYAVVFDTADASYLVKIDVKIDGNLDDDDDKDFFEDDIDGAEEVVDTADESSDDE